MARSNTHTLVPLDRFVQVMGLSIIHFNNLRDESQTAAARPYWNQAAHDEMAIYLAQAEAGLREGSKERPGLGFDIAPVERTSEIMFRGITKPWWLEVLTTPYQHVQAFGSYASAEIESGATINFDGDTATITVTVPSGTEAGEVRVFYTVSDGAAGAADEAWQIRPLTVIVDDTTATITGHKAQFAKPSVLDAEDPSAYSDSGSFVSTVDVYRYTIDAELPLSVIWDAYRVAQGDPTANLTQSAAARLLSGRLGSFQVRAATYADSAHTFSWPAYDYAPESVEASYIGGYALYKAGSGLLDPMLETAAIRLANVLSPNYAHWMNDLAQIKWRNDREIDENNPLQPGEEDCPYGLQNGSRFAWRVVRQMRVGRSPI